MKMTVAKRVEYGKKMLQSYQRRPKKGPRMVLFTGGTGSRSLARELRKYTHNASYIINTSDSGGSTRELRLLFKMPAIGDFRSRLLDLAEERSTADLLHYRLPRNRTTAELENEMNDLVTGRHKLVQAIIDTMEDGSSKALIIMDALRRFQAQRFVYERENECKFNLKNASIGNLFLTGLYLHYGRDLETPIYFYRQLAEVKGNVIPSTLDYVHLAAIMGDGTTLYGQHRITQSSLGRPTDLWYVDSDKYGARDLAPEVNPRALEAIRNAKLIVFSMGSFYTSILSNLKIDGIAEAIRKSRAPKVFIANSVEDEESKGMLAGDMAKEIIRASQNHDGFNGRETSYLTHIIANDFPKGSPIFKGKYGAKFGFLSSETKGLNRGIEIIKMLLVGEKLAKRYKAGSLKKEKELNELKKYDDQLLARLLFSFIKD